MKRSPTNHGRRLFRSLWTFACAILFPWLMTTTALADPAAVGVIRTIAGDGTAGFLGDGAAGTAARVNQPWGVAVDAVGNAYIADTYNHRIRMVTPAGVITTVAGNGTAGFLGDGALATSARLYYPTGVALDTAGNLYIADKNNNRIRKVTAATGVISTVAGSGAAGFGGDGGLATSAQLNLPISVAVDSSGNLYIGDQYNHRIRKVTAATGVISTLAGTGTVGYDGDGALATAALLNFPAGVGVDAAGNVYIADEGNSRVRKVAAGSGVITTVVGTGTAGFLGEAGPATAARLSDPIGLAVDGFGNVYIADHLNSRIRKLTVATGILTTV